MPLSYVYTFSYINDFSEILKEDQLYSEIENDSEFSGIKLKDVGRKGDKVNIYFNIELNGSQTAALSGLVAAHSPTISTFNAISTILTTLTPRTNIYNFTTYTRCATFNYPGTKFLPTISHFTCLAYATNSVQSYDIRIYDIDNDLEVYSGNYTNSSEQRLELSNLQNIPEDSTTIEIQVRMNVNGSTKKKYAYIDNITIFA
jgi:hypothetical protein